MDLKIYIKLKPSNQTIKYIHCTCYLFAVAKEGEMRTLP